MATIPDYIDYQGTIVLRRGSTLQWSTKNPILREGELGLDTILKILKMGDGTTKWNDLPVLGIEGPQGVIGPQGVPGPAGDVTPAALAAKQAAEDAASQSLASATASEDARDTAQAYKDAAEAAALLIGNSADVAQAAAADAANSASASALSASEAAASVTLAKAAQAAATAQAQAAAQSATQSANSATQAATVVSDVSNKADESLRVANEAKATATAADNRISGVSDVANNALAGANAANAALPNKADLAYVNQVSQKLTSIRNLRGGNGGVAGQVVVTFDEVVVRNAQGQTQRVGPSVGRVINSKVQGINGRDRTGSFSGEWTYVFAVWKAGATECDFIWTGNPTVPTNLFGYTHWAFLWPIRFDGAGVYVTHTVRGNHVVYPGGAGATLGQASIGAGGAYPMTGLGSYMPPSATYGFIRLVFTGVRTAGGGYLCEGSLRDDYGNTYESWYHGSNGNAGVAQGHTEKGIVPNYGGNYSVLTTASCTWNSNTVYMWIDGFDFEN